MSPRRPALPDALEDYAASVLHGSGITVEDARALAEGTPPPDTPDAATRLPAAALAAIRAGWLTPDVAQ